MRDRLLGELDSAPERARMIGDTTHDRQRALAAGMERVAIGHGAHDASELLQYGPLACVGDCDELWRWLTEHA